MMTRATRANGRRARIIVRVIGEGSRPAPPIEILPAPVTLPLNCVVLTAGGFAIQSKVAVQRQRSGCSNGRGVLSPPNTSVPPLPEATVIGYAQYRGCVVKEALP